MTRPLALALLVSCAPARPPLPEVPAAATQLADLRRLEARVARLAAAGVAARQLRAAELALARAQTPAQRGAAREAWQVAHAEMIFTTREDR